MDPNWRDLAPISELRENEEGLENASFWLWGDDVREAIFMEQGSSSRWFVHFRKTESCPHKSCVPLHSPDLLELEGEDREDAIEIERSRVRKRIKGSRFFLTTE